MDKIGYVTLEETKEYLKERYSDVAEDRELKEALYQSFDLIETINVRGNNPDIPTKFPRFQDRGVVPDNVKKSQMLEAYYISSGKSEQTNNIVRGIKSESVGDMSISYDKTQKIGHVLFSNPAAARIMKLYERKTF